MNKSKVATKISEFPDLSDGETYLLVEDASVHIPGDERSRTNPGHGYPAHSVDYVRTLIFYTLEDLKKFLCAKSSVDTSKFRVYKMNRISVNSRVVVDIDYYV